MNKADTPRVLASITAVATATAVVALSAAVFYDSVRLVALGLLMAFVATRADRYRVNQVLNAHVDQITARDETLHNRIRQIVTWWQADIHAVANGTPRPDPSAVLHDQPPSPRQGGSEGRARQQHS